MARLQILELPSGADDDRPPFILVIDETGDDSPLITDGPNIWPAFKADTGCRHVIVTTETIDIPANDTTAYLDAPKARQEVVAELAGQDPQSVIDAAIRKVKDDPQAGLQ